jgi:RNA polymerase sigma-70 factor (ECF subfamily)
MIARPSPQRRSSRDEAVPDPDVLKMVANGDIGALGELYDRYREPIRRLLARATANAEDVDDLVHTTFLEAAKSAGRYDGRPSCRPWLAGIAVQLLRRRRRSFRTLAAVLTSLRDTRTAAADPRSALEAHVDVDQALATISEAKRVALLLVEVEGLSCQEAAAVLAIPVGTVWTRLHAARRELRRALAEDRTR